MKTLQMNSQALFKIRWIHFLMPIAIVLLWLTLPRIIHYYEPTAGLLDAGFLQLIFLAMICYFGFVLLCAIFLNRCWVLAGLPPVKIMVSHFQFLDLWQQLGLFWASFALLLLAGVGCLAAVL